MFKNKKVFISGGNGVIGNCLVRKLHSMGAIVYVGDLKPRPADWPGEIRYRQGDLNYITAEELSDFAPEFFFHLAATFERSSETYSFWHENFQHNVKLSNHLMTCLKDCPSLKKVIFASSYLIYDPALYQFNAPAATPRSLKETDPIYPRNLTGVAKLSHEIELRFINEFKHDAYKIISARIYRGHGLNSRDIISRWARALINNEELVVYRKEGMFDYIYSEDSAEGLLRLAACEEAEGVINLGTGKARKVADILDILKKEFPGLKYKEMEETVDIPYEASQADITLLRELTGWAPEFSLEESVKAIVNFERKRGGIYDNAQLPDINVLVTSISRKVPLLESVRKALNKIGRNNALFGGDVDGSAIAQYFVDHFWTMPKLSDEVMGEIVSFCSRNGIKLIIPTRDGELGFWAKHADLLAGHGITVMGSSGEAIEKCLDKLLFFEALSDKLPIIQTTTEIDKLPVNSEYVVKERFGAGALNIGIQLNREAALEHAEKLSHPIFQPYVHGREYSIDAYITAMGTVKGVVVRSRDKVIGGESQVTTVEDKPILESLCIQLVNSLSLKGHIVLQVIEDAEGKFHIIECNPRFGGASTLSVAAGLDSFYWQLLESLKVDIAVYPFLKTRGKLRQVRFASDKLIFN